MKKTVSFITALCLGISLFIGRGVDSLAAAYNISTENLELALSEDGFWDCPKSGFENQPAHSRDLSRELAGFFYFITDTQRGSLFIGVQNHRKQLRRGRQPSER